MKREVAATFAFDDDKLTDAERRHLGGRRDDEIRRRRLAVLERAVAAAVEQVEHDDRADHARDVATILPTSIHTALRAVRTASDTGEPLTTTVPTGLSATRPRRRTGCNYTPRLLPPSSTDLEQLRARLVAVARVDAPMLVADQHGMISYVDSMLAARARLGGRRPRRPAAHDDHPQAISRRTSSRVLAIPHHG